MTTNEQGCYYIPDCIVNMIGNLYSDRYRCYSTTTTADVGDMAAKYVSSNDPAILSTEQ